MSAGKFLLLCLSVFIALFIGYASLVESRAVPSGEFPLFYQQLVLESAAPLAGKVVVESGSNSVHSINPTVLSDYFQAPVIVTAVNAGFPLGPKIYNLEKNLQPGDILILPLEWNQYAYPESYPSDFVSLVLDPRRGFGHFFNNMPLQEKYRFIYTQLPFESARTAIRENNRKPLRKAAIERRLSIASTRATSGGPNAFGSNLRPGPEPLSIGMFRQLVLKQCDDYLFVHQRNNDFEISTAFRRNLSTLQRLSRKGVQVYFTWPAVVDHPESPCYQTPIGSTHSVASYANKIQESVEAAGFEFIGTPLQSRMPAECFLNTYYHLTEACALKRTRNLVQAFSHAGITPLHSHNTPEQLLSLVNENIANMRARIQ